MANVYTTHTMAEHAAEKGAYVVPISAFYDEDGSAVTPTAVTWSLYDVAKAIINSREDVSETPATAIDIVLSGDDLEVSSTVGRERTVYITYTYNSDNGTGLIGRINITVQIDSLTGV